MLTFCYPKKKKKISLPSPPMECGWLMVTGEAENLLLLPPPPPLNLPGLRRSRKMFATTPPPPNLVGLRRSRKIGPPQKKILATPLVEGSNMWSTSYVAESVIYRMHACMLACLHACMLACLHACMLACLHACMLACLHACMLACMH